MAQLAATETRLQDAEARARHAESKCTHFIDELAYERDRARVLEESCKRLESQSHDSKTELDQCRTQLAQCEQRLADSLDELAALQDTLEHNKQLLARTAQQQDRHTEATVNDYRSMLEQSDSMRQQARTKANIFLGISIVLVVVLLVRRLEGLLSILHSNRSRLTMFEVHQCIVGSLLVTHTHVAVAVVAACVCTLVCIGLSRPNNACVYLYQLSSSREEGDIVNVETSESEMFTCALRWNET